MPTHQQYEDRIKRLEGQLSRMQAHLHDESMTRIHAQTALGKVEEQLALALDAARLATWQWNLSRRQIHLGARWTEITDGILMSIDLNDKEWMTRVHTADLALLQHTLAQVVTKKRERFIAQFRYQSNRDLHKPWVWIEMIGVLQKQDEQDSDRYLIGCASDITARKEKVDELKLARDHAEQASQAKTEFLAHVSHELRTPLHAVLSMAEMMRLDSSGLSTSQTEHLGFLSQSAEHVLSLVNDLLDYASFERNQNTELGASFEPHYQAVNVNHWIKGVCEPFKQQSHNKPVQFLVGTDIATTTTVKLDLRRTTQVVNNLLTNAFKFTETGKVELFATLMKQQLIIAIKDTGIGVARDKLDSIFKPFTQADQGIQRQFGGTGLGLSICHTICERLGGNIQVSSTPGAGSTFTVTLPALELAQTTHTHASVISPTLTPLPSSLKVLVVDDNAVNLKVASAYAQQLSIHASTCDTAMKALAMLQAERFDIVLVDLQMPHMSGFDLLNTFKQTPSHDKAIKWVAATAHAMPGYEKKCLSLGFDGFISKPFNVQALHATLLQHSGLTAHNDDPAHNDNAVLNASDLGRADLGQTFLQLFGFDKTLMKDISNALTQDTPKRLAQMRQALDQGNIQEIAKQAHALKGAFSQLGDTHVSALLQTIENQPQGLTQPDLQSLTERITACIDTVAKVSQSG